MTHCISSAIPPSSLAVLSAQTKRRIPKAANCHETCHQEVIPIVLKCIRVSDLRLGMYIHALGGSWVDHPFWKSSFLLDSPRDLRKLRDCALQELWIDTTKGLDVSPDTQSLPLPEGETDAKISLSAVPDDGLPAIVEAIATPSITDTSSTSFAEEMKQAIILCNQSRQAIMSLFGEARLGHAIDLEQASHLVGEVTNSVLRNPHALASLVRLKTADDYTYMHSIAVCVLMISLARQLRLNDQLVHEAGLAGLLHDIGKIAIPDHILNKPGKLTDEEFDIVKQHPAAGGEILRRNLDVSTHALDVCLHHHEKMDGSGYPHQLSSERISLLSRMGAVCDVYDAVTSDRPYKRGWGPADSLHRMATWKNHFDQRILQAFVKAMGVYPTGSLVRLESGRLAVVLEQHPYSLLTPKIKVFFCSTTGRPLPHQVVDLATSKDRILSRESPDHWGFKQLEQLWM